MMLTNIVDYLINIHLMESEKKYETDRLVLFKYYNAKPGGK